ncbi:DNA-3-methyladenine glycosylase I [Sphingobacterium corticibacter]|uniref:DNA-3-methyladenine glycosylase I n=1 Tax=Sphingobacterium corticibacter TaxID=2171749 RepID=A0A2T8HFG3_9SPHI|nr:DNA-3-methyladenine glycosylase I [Sphingobacterium corticibacter]PVH24102.1 DNA-3-methyladenine glycosylase I [Sphingobacterium corticibacter]
MAEQNYIRCGWCGQDELYQDYHDQEWGRLVTDDRTLFEFLVLESAQAGLSWITILRKRENYRRVFADFDPVAVAQFTEDDVERILLDAGIIRNRLKVKSTITNAQIFLAIQEQFGSFYQYLYSFMPNNQPITNHFHGLSEVPAATPISDAIAKDLKKRGVKFFGTTICYAYMQAVGMVNDHVMDCSFR